MFGRRTKDKRIASEQARLRNAEVRKVLVAEGQSRRADIEVRNRMAYDSAVARLIQQSETIDTFRGRAAGLFSVAALIASISTTAGLTDALHPLPLPASVLLMIFMVGIGLCATVVLWPLGGWSYAPDALGILGYQGAVVDLLKEATEELADGIEENEDRISFRVWWYRSAGALTLLETLTVVIGSLLSR